MSLVRAAERCLANQSARANLNAFISRLEPADVLAQVEKTTAQLGEEQRPLHGKLIAIKDNICTSDLPTTAASGILKSFTSPYEATVVKKLRDHGAIICGKTNMDEFGMGSHSKHSFFGVAKQEGDDGKVLSAGGSSGGSAVAVATGQCWAALGTDTGGSVRLPAAYTGVVGFKPSYGRISRWGVIAYANSLDTVGILAKDIWATRRIFAVAGGAQDEKDPTNILPFPRNTDPEMIPRKMRIGVPIEYNITELQPSVRSTWARSLRILQDLGHSIHPISLPTTQHALSAYYVLAPAEASSNLAKYDGVRYGSRAAGVDGTPDSVLFSKTRGEGFGAEVKRRIVLGAFSLSSEAIDNYFIQAQKIRRLVQTDFDRVFRTDNPLLGNDERRGQSLSEDFQSRDVKVDAIVCPTAPTLAPTLEELEGQTPVDAYMNDVFTVPASLAGLPAVSVPICADGNGEQPKAGGSVGIQIIGQYGDDELVLDIAELLQIDA